MDSPPARRRSPLWSWLILPGFPALLLAAYFSVPLGVFGPEHPELSWTVFVLALAALAVLVLSQIRLITLESERGVPGLVILAASSLALVIFAGTYVSLARQPGQFSGLQTRVDALYFTVVTVATVGYGDIVPTGQVSRVVVMLQIGYTLVFLAAGYSAISNRLRGRISRRAQPRHPDQHG
ncbi:potassium channel family protein [Kitasatospora azatica]|uniref:potassium channel family protein n=1 Tax=Kitasatospora azatica TaxID=58347 RepID=UPI000A02A2BD|nr:potassium channel family protein [Kitasatospora azatica]